MRKNGLRNLPTMEQPYEKCLENGPESLSDAELLAVILRCGARGKTSLELAREILSLPGKEEGLLGLYHCTRQELLQIRGVGEVKAIQLQCIGELSKRMAAAGARKGLCFHDPASIADYYMERLRQELQHIFSTSRCFCQFVQVSWCYSDDLIIVFRFHLTSHNYKGKGISRSNNICLFFNYCMDKIIY